MGPQDQALLWELRDRGVLSPDELERLRTVAGEPSEPLSDRLIREGWLTADGLVPLLRQLARSSFQCRLCHYEIDYAELARMAALNCSSCAGPLQRVEHTSDEDALYNSAEDDEFRKTPPEEPFTPPTERQTSRMAHGKGGTPEGNAPEKPGIPDELLATKVGGLRVLDLPGNRKSSQPRDPFPDLGQGRKAPSGRHAQRRSSRRDDPRRGASGSFPAQAGNYRLGPYKILRELGRGCHGVVFLAQRQGLERMFALKVLRNAHRVPQQMLARFKLESAVASKLNHPGVISVFDAGKEGNDYYYAMEYVQGETLEERLRHGPMEPRAAAELVLELARTSAAAHARSVIHRDLKPANILLQEGSNRPRITDFGLAQDRTLTGGALTQAGDRLGTPYYMSPEQFRGERDLDGRVDVYALGVILYEAMCGQRPFEAPTTPLLAPKVLKETPTAPRKLRREIPKALEGICLRAMSRHRDERTMSAQALVYDLERFLTDDAHDDASTLWIIAAVAGGAVGAALAAAVAIKVLG